MPNQDDASTEMPATEQAASVSPSRFAVEPFRGTNGELQAFIEQTWSKAYMGTMSFPIWSTEYFDWQLSPRDGEPDRRLAVYDNDRVVAVLVGVPATFCTPSATFRGAHWSWLSVAASHRGCGLATLLDEARVQLEHEAGSELIVSYRFIGSKHSLAEKPSARFPLKVFHSRLGFWARPLDGRRLQGWNLDRTEGFLSRLVSPCLPAANLSQTGSVRMMKTSDLDDCKAVAERHFNDTALADRWDERVLEHQLAGSPVAQTVVVEHDGKVQGFVNYHVLPFAGRNREPVAIVDMICAKLLPARLQSQLLKGALATMRDQGAILALKLRCGDVSPTLLFRSGFLPRLADSSLVLQWTQSVREIPRHQPLHLLWR